jgi:hypothetical protein
MSSVLGSLAERGCAKLLLFQVEQHNACEIGVLKGYAAALSDSHTLIHFVDRAEVRLLLGGASRWDDAEKSEPHAKFRNRESHRSLLS